MSQFLVHQTAEATPANVASPNSRRPVGMIDAATQQAPGGGKNQYTKCLDPNGDEAVPCGQMPTGSACSGQLPGTDKGETRDKVAKAGRTRSLL